MVGKQIFPTIFFIGAQLRLFIKIIYADIFFNIKTS